jgi:UDP-3-O-[3-hydroxymyristoyl] glucosamine N-acyltransferase
MAAASVPTAVLHPGVVIYDDVRSAMAANCMPMRCCIPAHAWANKVVWCTPTPWSDPKGLALFPPPRAGARCPKPAWWFSRRVLRWAAAAPSIAPPWEKPASVPAPRSTTWCKSATALTTGTGLCPGLPGGHCRRRQAGQWGDFGRPGGCGQPRPSWAIAAIASSKSGIHGEVAAGEVVSGYPAIPNRLWLRCSAAFSKLPELASKRDPQGTQASGLKNSVT